MCAAAAQEAKDVWTTPSPLRWVSVTNKDLQICGLPWFDENHGLLERLPERSKTNFRSAVWTLSRSPSGGQIRFSSDTKVLALKLEYPGPPNMANMHAYGQTGVDVYVDGSCIYTATARTNSRPGIITDFIAFDFSDRPPAQREITIYLPLYKGVQIHGIGVDPDSRFRAPKPFAQAKAVVFYGTSVTQGGAASHPGMSYPALLGRKLNLDFVNLGFSGNGLGEPEVARAVAEIDASCFVLDFGANHKKFKDMQDAYASFLDLLRAKHPLTSILALSPIYTAREARSESFAQDWRQRREFIRNVVNERVAKGDKHLRYVSGTDLLGPSQADGLVDGSHPNDLGFYWMAQALAPHLRQILNLP